MVGLSKSGGSRIPMALQQVFVSSQKGGDVTKIRAPTGMGYKVFQRSWGKKQKKLRAPKPPVAPTLNSERSSGFETAADAARKAMKGKSAPPVAPVDQASPQVFLDQAIASRGYATRKYCSLEGGYYCRPSPLQQASYGSRLSQAVRASDATLLRRLLDSGLSPNPCNNYGESLVHMVCRRGDHKLLRILLEAGCSLQVTDDYGRTPLHDAFWRAEPSFETVQLILNCDKDLIHLLDCRGASPLGYVRKANYKPWSDYLESKLDRFWPKREVSSEGEERPPSLTLRQPHSLPIPDPDHSLPLEVASMVANGQMEPEEATYLDDDSSDDDDSSSSYSSEEESDDDMSEAESEESNDSDDSDFDLEEMAEICLRAGGPMAIARKCFGSEVKVVGGGRKTA